MDQEKYKTMWKILETRCAIVADVVKSARLPLFLIMSWTFVWAWAIYIGGGGYLNTLHKRYANYIMLASKVANDITAAKDTNQPKSDLIHEEIISFLKTCKTRIMSEYFQNSDEPIPDVKTDQGLKRTSEAFERCKHIID